MKRRFSDMSTEELQGAVDVTRQRLFDLEKLLAERLALNGECLQKTPCTLCCEHVFRSSTGPRDNGVYERVCEKCGYAD